ncbi:hypothetical protein HAX54_016467, partial [Datura stramonium]|nr:hypothetical protein [Datura stramonium]
MENTYLAFGGLKRALGTDRVDLEVKKIPKETFKATLKTLKSPNDGPKDATWFSQWTMDLSIDF